MQLKSLERFDDVTASQVIAAAALAMEPGEQAIEGVSRQAVDDLLNEIRKTLNIGSADIGADAKNKIDNVLSDALDKAINVERLTAAAKRAGSDGKLLTGAYNISFNKFHFKNQFKPLGEREGFVRSMIKSSVERQDLDVAGNFGNVPYFVDEKFGSPTIFTYFWTKNKSKAHWVIIQTHRFEENLVVEAVWRLVPGMFDLRGASSPRDLLVLFANKFGKNIRIGSDVGKFLGPHKIDGTEIKLFAVPDIYTATAGGVVYPEKDSFLVLNAINIQNPPGVIMNNVYCVDVLEYRAALVEEFGHRWLSDHG